MKKPRRKKWTPEALQKLSNEAFLDLAVTAFADRTDLREGDLLIENKIKHGAPPEAMDMVLAEAARRGIAPETIAQRITTDAMAGHSFISNLLAPSAWKRYELKAAHAIRGILKAHGARVDRYEFDAKIVGKITGQTKQVDLLLVQEQPKHVVACEFRHYTRRVPVEDVEAFATRLRDLGANKGIMVTPCGYQRGAIAVAHPHGIELFQFQELFGRDLRSKCPDRVQGVVNEGRYWLLQDQHGSSWVFEEH
jgi:hypothetical protein